MIKAIFFDIDGTILSHKQKKVPDSTVEALNILKAKGIKTFIATGRHISEMRDLPINDIEFDGYITLNGQYCFNKEGIIYDLPIDQEDINHIIEMIDEESFPCIFVESELMYINYYNRDVEIVQEAISTDLPEINDLHRGYKEKIYQVIPYGIDNNKEKEILKVMSHCKATRWHDLAIDIIPDIGGKNNGIKHVLDYYGIDLSETMAFGDGENDIPMLEYCHIGVAMGNSKDIVKQRSDYVTDDIDSDGIFKALKHYKVI